MVIEISNVTYRKGYGQKLDEVKAPGLLAKLNSIIEWDHCVFPPKQKEGSTEDIWIEDRDFLGPEPELKVGSAFKFGNQLLAVEDDETLVLVMSETGIGGLQRVWKDKITPEFNIVFGTSPDGAEFENAPDEEIPESWVEKRIPYEVMRLLKDRMIPGRNDELFKEKGTKVKATLHSSVILFPIHLYITDWGFWYDPSELETDEIDLVEKELVSELYNKFPRIKTSNENPYEKRNKAVAEAKKMSQQILQQIMPEQPDNSGQAAPDPTPTRYSDNFTDIEDEDEKNEEYKDVLYYKLSKEDLLGTGDLATVLELSDLPNGLRDSNYEKFGVKFESDFQEYAVAELMESIFEVCDTGTLNYADEDVLRKKLENNLSYIEGNW